MNRVLISVEGQTEETFVKELMRQFLWDQNVDLIPIIVATKIVKSGQKFKGGLVSYDQPRNEIMKLLRDKNAVAVTTMYDLYALPSDFPGYSSTPSRNCYSKVAHLERMLQQDINNPKFHPYIQLHEFETFLFVDPNITGELLVPDRGKLTELQNIRQSYSSPEEINDNPQTAPSKRILALYPNYDKPIYGTLITAEIGLDRLRSECNHFCQWFNRIISISGGVVCILRA